MQKIKSIAFALVIGVASIGLSPPTASATVILNVTGGILTGARNVDVGGTLFDVTFADGTCITLFSGCDAPADYTFTTNPAAGLAAQALLDQVFNDSPSGMFDSNPSLTAGCTSTFRCNISIPVFNFLGGLGRRRTPRVAITVALNTSPSAGTDSLVFTNLNIGTDTTFFPNRTYAIFLSPTSAAIPEPGTLLLFVGGLAILAAFGHPRRRA